MEDQTGRLANAIREEAQYQGNPLTCRRLYDETEAEYLKACDAYRRQHKKLFLTNCDCLRIMLEMGYRKE